MIGAWYYGCFAGFDMLFIECIVVYVSRLNGLGFKGSDFIWRRLEYPSWNMICLASSECDFCGLTERYVYWVDMCGKQLFCSRC